jgi:hypothetical protein
MRRAALLALIALAALVAPATAAAAGEGVIAGTVTPVAIAPEVEVCLVESRPSVTCTSPAADGTYTLGGLPVATGLRIEFIPSYRSHYAIQYYAGARTLAEATPITLAPPPPERLNVNAELELGGAIEGTVEDAAGIPLRGVEACVLEAGRGISFGCTETDAGGGYALGGLPPGSYKVGFWGRGASAEYASGYHGGATTFAAAAPVQVTPGATVAGVDGTLAKGATVTGTVIAAASATPLESVPVCAFAAAASTPVECTYTGLGGTYALVGLAAGAYQIGFSLGSAEIGGEAVSAEDDGYLTQYYRGVSNRGEAQTLTLFGGAVESGVDAALLTPSAPPVIAPPAPPADNIVTPPPTVTVPSKPAPPKCRKGLVKKKVKGATKCVKKPKRAKKHHKKKAKKRPRTHHRKSKKHGEKR